MVIADGNEIFRAAWAQAWQVTILIVVVALSTRLLVRNRPHLAYVLWLVVLVKCVTPPVWGSAGGVFCWLRSPVRATALQSSPLTESRPSTPEVAFGPTPWEGSLALPDTPVRAEPPVRRWGAWVMPAVMVGWILGAVGTLAVAATRLVVCLGRIRRSDWRSDRSLDRLMSSLSRRLRLRRPARLVVTKSLVGPAVVGLFRPTVLLPDILVRGKSTAELEPILAHELIHVRRGDAWVGMLQTAARAVWWFHPLVWWAGHSASREAECCCDEAVLAELGCNPARYARCLFEVLEQKHLLKPVPACPGARPVEVTSRRLERIMRLGLL